MSSAHESPFRIIIQLQFCFTNDKHLPNVIPSPLSVVGRFVGRLLGGFCGFFVLSCLVGTNDGTLVGKDVGSSVPGDLVAPTGVGAAVVGSLVGAAVAGILVGTDDLGPATGALLGVEVLATVGLIVAAGVGAKEASNAPHMSVPCPIMTAESYCPSPTSATAITIRLVPDVVTESTGNTQQ